MKIIISEELHLKGIPLGFRGGGINVRVTPTKKQSRYHSGGKKVNKGHEQRKTFSDSTYH